MVNKFLSNHIDEKTRKSINMKKESIEKIIQEIRADGESVMVPPRIRIFDEPELLPERNGFVMSSGVTRTSGGRLWLSWFGGEDGAKAYLMMASSDDDAKTWSKPRYIIKESHSPHGFERSVLGGNLWTDPLGRMWCFFTYCVGYFDGRGGVWCSVCENPDADELIWSTPRRIWNGFVLNKPIIQSNGEWLLPTSLWNRYLIAADSKNLLPGNDLYKELDKYRMANFLVSADQGESWKRRGGACADCRYFDEPSFIEKSDGELLCLLRTYYGLAETESSDYGRNWSTPVPSQLKHCSARIFTTRLKSGRILLIKHGPPYKITDRSHLTAYLSDDDGKSWHGGLILDERNSVSYPDGFQAPDGRIYITYDHKRVGGEILLAIFSEEDIYKGSLVSPSSRLKIPVQRTASIINEEKDI